MMTTSPCPARIETVIRTSIVPDKNRKGFWITYKILPGLTMNKQPQHKNLVGEVINVYDREIYC